LGRSRTLSLTLGGGYLLAGSPGALGAGGHFGREDDREEEEEEEEELSARGRDEEGDEEARVGST